MECFFRALVRWKHGIKDFADASAIDHEGESLEEGLTLKFKRWQFQRAGKGEVRVGEQRKRKMQPVHRLPLIFRVLGAQPKDAVRSCLRQFLVMIAK